MESFLLKKFLFEWKEKEGIKLGKGIIEEIREHFFLSFWSTSYDVCLKCNLIF